MTRALWDSLKTHILRERHRKKQGKSYYMTISLGRGLFSSEIKFLIPKSKETAPASS